MIYNDFKNIKLSALGYGCMRLPLIDNDYNKVDINEAKKLFKIAIDNGINYFDTAYVYHGGNGEKIVGEILKSFDRNKYFIATKFPSFSKDYFENIDKIFNEQLDNLKVSYFDFYLCHCISEDNIDLYLNKSYKLFEYLKDKKEKGTIKYLGFSCHSSLKTMIRFLDMYGSIIDFCQIQLNYLDYRLQNAKAKVDFLNEKNIPIWVMEPVRGGRLAKLNAIDENKLHSLRDESIPAFAFRYLQSIKGVTMILSGMSNYEQLLDNLKTFETFKPLNSNELLVIDEIVNKMMDPKNVYCTACRYCIDNCSARLNIPGIIAIYNEAIKNNRKLTKESFNNMSLPSDCISCKKCEKHCPQGIKISELMKEIAKMIED